MRSFPFYKKAYVTTILGAKHSLVSGFYLNFPVSKITDDWLCDEL